MKNPFFLDKLRHKLAIEGNSVELRNSYKHNSNFIDRNTPEFWNKKISKSKTSQRLVRMTKDRVLVAVNLVLVNKKSKKIIDLGFGYGDFLTLINKRDSKTKLYGIDISDKAVLRIRKKISGEFKAGSILKIPFHRKKFDTVVALEVLEHLTAREVPVAYKEIRRVLEKKGQLIASVPVNENYSNKFNPNLHMRSYTPELFIEELRLFGFKILKVKKFFAFSRYYIVKKIMQRIFPKRWKPNVILVVCSKSNI